MELDDADGGAALGPTTRFRFGAGITNLFEFDFPEGGGSGGGIIIFVSVSEVSFVWFCGAGGRGGGGMINEGSLTDAFGRGGGGGPSPM